MKISDIIFALVCGKVIGFVASDLIRGFGIPISFYESIVLWIIFPVIALFFLWLANIIGKKLLFVFESAKFFLVGAFATVIDLKLYELFLWFFPFSILAKSISFIFSTILKYWGNKYWTFGKHEKENMKKEITQFFAITLVGLAIDVSAFYYATKIVGTQFGLPAPIWIKLSVILAALATALWNFLGYKFLVFKKEL